MGVPILTGLAAGAVHVVGGADYLVAMAPFASNDPSTPATAPWPGVQVIPPG